MLPVIPFISASTDIDCMPSTSGVKRKAGSPLRETEVLTDDNHLGLVTVEIVAGDEGNKVHVKVIIRFKFQRCQVYYLLQCHKQICVLFNVYCMKIDCLIGLVVSMYDY